MRPNNRALRATASLILVWVCLRGSILIIPFPDENQPARVEMQVVPPVSAISVALPPSVARPLIQKLLVIQPVSRSVAHGGFYGRGSKKIQIVLDAPANETLRQPERLVLASNVEPDIPRLTKPIIEAKPRRKLPDRSVSAYTIIRPSSSGQTLATNGQLGASQAGVRVQLPFAVISERQVAALNFRASAPIDQRIGREIGVGVTLRRIGRIPIELIAERRIGLDRGARNAFAIIATTGFDDWRIAHNVNASGYVQGGIVGFARQDAFVDGALRLEHSLSGRNRTGLAFGAGLWGAAQPSVSRIDIGPLVSLKQPIGGANFRISAEYRLRVSGRARPASGPALSIGADF